MLKGKIRVLLFGLAGFIFIVGLSGSASADNVVQGLKTKTKLDAGTIVRISTDTSTIAEKLPAGRSDLIFGVVIDKALSPVYVEHEGATTYVASQGEYQVLVDTENGPISVGDYISGSYTDGIGAKATGRQPLVLGKATSSFNGQTGVVGSAGRYKIGKVSVDINIIRNPNFKNTLAIPGPLQKLGNSIAGRETSPFKVYVALVLFLVATVLTLVLLTVGTRGGLVAIGRNPLSKHSVLKALFEVIGAALVIFITSLIGVYLLLRL